MKPQKSSKTPIARNREGSTIVGVLAALVFIGVVVAAMVKNTGVQSATSRGYSAATVMGSTASSGIVATEGFFFGNSSDVAKNILDSIVNFRGNGKYVFGNSAQGKRQLSASSGQYFSSKATGCFQDKLTSTGNGGYLDAGFRIAAGKNARGKNLKEAMALFRFGNLNKQSDRNVPIKNAVYIRNGINNADAGMTTDSGNVTIEGNTSFQNAPATFDKDAFFEKPVKFPSTNAWFKDKAYFMDSVTFQGTANFDSAVYFKNFAYFSEPAVFKNKVYFLNGAEFKKTVSFDSLVYFSNINNNDKVKFAGHVTFNNAAYFTKSIEFMSGAKATFHKTAYFTQPSKFDGEAVFNDKAYFSGKPDLKKATFNGKAYFLAGADFNGGNESINFNDSAYFDGSGPAGTITFHSPSKFHNVAQFMKAATFKNDVTFNKWAYFGNTATFDGAAGTFLGETYFGDLVTFNNKVSVFRHRLAIEKNIKTNKVIESQKDSDGNKYDVLISGQFATGPGTEGGGIKGNGASNHALLYKSGAFTASDIAKCTNFGADEVKANGDLNNGVWASGKLKYIKPEGEKGNVSNLMATPTAPTLPTIPTPPTVESRRDPELSIAEVYKDTANGGVKIHKAKDVMTVNGSTFDIDKLRQSYATALASPNNLYNRKYMVIEITTIIAFRNLPAGSAPDTLDANIIYIIKNGGTLDAATNFYTNSSDTANTSTLIYVGTGNAKLEQFGTSGVFRGFIYIDRGNTANNSLKFPGKGKIIGAVHNFSTVPLGWNTGTPGYSIKVVFDPDVISGFGTLYPPPPGSPPPGGGVTIKPGGLDVTPLGYYFY